MAKGVYGTASNNGSTVLGFGATPSDSTTNLAAAQKQIEDNASSVTHGSVTTTISGGTKNYFGNVITPGGTSSINGFSTDILSSVNDASDYDNGMTRKLRLSQITAFNMISGAATASSNNGNKQDAKVGSRTDKHVDAVDSPYAVPARLTYVGGIAPVTTTYGDID